MLPEQQQRILGYFIEEARDHLNTIEQGLLNLSATLNDSEMVNEVFRAAHSIKGGAAMLGLTSIQRTSHRLEDCFKILKETPNVEIDQKLESLFLGVSDTLKALLEHLQGPFGLTEEAANDLMSEAEPVFGWLHEHLDMLVKKSKGIVVSTEVPASTPDNQIAQSSELVVSSESEKWQLFQTGVLQVLRDMLQVFKQPATSETRQQLQECCHQLFQSGSQLSLKNWCSLCQAAKGAIGNPENSYLVLAKTVITEIRQALELVQQGRDAEVTVSSHLEALLSVPQLELLEVSATSEEVLPTISEDFSHANSPDVVDINLQNKETSNNELQLPINNFDNSLDDAEFVISSEFDEHESLSIVPRSELSSLSDIDEEFNISIGIDSFDRPGIEILVDDEEASEAGASIFDPNGPEVGMAELTTLAHLFEHDSHELDETWVQQEDLINTNTVKNLKDLEVDSSLDKIEVADSDLEDLLTLKEKTVNVRDSQVAVPQDLTLVELFGDEFLDDDNSKPEHEETILIDFGSSGIDIDGELIRSAKDESDDDALNDLLALSAEPKNKVDVKKIERIESIETNDNIESLDIFSSAEDVSPDEEINLISKTPSSMTFVQYETLDSLLAFSPEDTPLPGENSEFSDLFADVDDLSQDINIDFLQPEQVSTVAASLEESLFAATGQTETQNKSVDLDLELSLDKFDISSEIDTEQVLFSETSEFFIVEDLPSQLLDNQEDDLFLEITPALPDISEDKLDNINETEVLSSDQELFALDFSSYEDNLNNESQNPLLTESIDDDAEIFSTFLPPSEESFLNLSDDIQVEEKPQDLLDDLFTIEYEPESSFVDNSSKDEQENLHDTLDLDLIRENSLELNISKIQERAGETLVYELQLEEFQTLESLLDEVPENQDNPVEFTLEFDENAIDNSDNFLASIPDKINAEKEVLEKEAINNTSDDDFAHLEALLGSSPDKNEEFFVPEDDFAALEALLGDECEKPKSSFPETSEINAIVPKAASLTSSTNKSSNSTTINSEFGDLEKLLAEADKSISVAGSSNGNAFGSRSGARRVTREQLMKVPVKHLDDMSNLVGELVVNRNTLEQDQERLRQSLDNLLHQVQQLSDVGARMQELYERSLLEASLLATRTSKDFLSPTEETDRGFSELEMDRFTPFHTLSQEMIELIVRVRESASDIDFVTEETERVARQFRQVTTQLQEGLTRARMEPFSQVTDRLKRGVRDNAIKCGKQVDLHIEGQDTLIDKMILQHLTDPLTHMLNNAIAHGIETPEERRALGKAEQGAINVRAFHQGNQTVISVSDDGAGIDHERVKSKAIKVGLITPEEAHGMSRSDIYELLFQPGFSTKDQADGLAGRGVGMDVVLTSISEIRGTITTDSKKGKGTTFTIRLPLTLSICKALCCVSDKARIAFPMDGVEDTLDVHVKNIQHSKDGQTSITWRDTQLPFKPLKDLLTFNRQLSRGNVYGGNRDDDMVSVVVVRSASTMIALQIDQVLSEQEIVIKQFEAPAPKPVGVAGATVLGDGRVMPIADVLEIIDLFYGRTSKQSGVSFREPPTVETEKAVKIDPTVLIVDDSITVRELLSLTFNKAGYRVEQARDGQEAWDKLRSGLPCDIVFCDIEMPRCDGLELLSRIQKEPSLNHLPIAMLTSRGADKHRQMAINLGASGYFTKPYLEEALLDAASRMLKGENLVSS
ncbi:MAG: response regulator [Scytonematopsis contorta HA4267-MV1]|jgi:chemosensory pili system protein ChpA (sensor histidine kinase/response regulator)|nr:response regulator [Scytonematopsis contorta HA4267-MV1]